MNEREREAIEGIAGLASDLAMRLDDLAGFAGELQPGDIAWRMRRAREKALAIHNELIELSLAGRPAPADPSGRPIGLLRTNYHNHLRPPFKKAPFKATLKPVYRDDD